jgi:uncharacterized membrane protein
MAAVSTRLPCGSAERPSSQRFTFHWPIAGLASVVLLLGCGSAEGPALSTSPTVEAKTEITPAPPLYQVIELPLLAQGTYAQVLSINDGRQVVGRGDTVEPATGRVVRGFSWQFQGGRTTVLAPLAGFDHSGADGVNEIGETIGASWKPDGRGVLVAGTMWSKNSNTALNGLWEANDINAKGQVVGHINDAGRPVAAMWQQGVTRTLDVRRSRAHSINDNGHVVGQLLEESKAMIWRDGMAHELKLPSRVGGASPQRINNRGQIGGQGASVDGIYLALFWENQSAEASILPMPMWEQFGLGVHQMNDLGHVVGWGHSYDASHALLWWYGATAVYDINDLIHPDDPLKGKIWIEEAFDINNNGDIVAWGYSAQAWRSFLLTPVTSTSYKRPAVPGSPTQRPPAPQPPRMR